MNENFVPRPPDYSNPNAGVSVYVKQNKEGGVYLMVYFFGNRLKVPCWKCTPKPQPRPQIQPQHLEFGQ